MTQTESRLIRVLIAEDSSDATASVSSQLTGQPSLQLVGVATEATEAISLAEAQQPDVALIDVRVPGGGPKAAGEIRRVSPETRVVALSYEDRDGVLDMLREGSVGYVLKSSDIGDLVGAIERSLQGQALRSGRFTAAITHEYSTHRQKELKETEAQRRKMDRIQAVLEDPDSLYMVFQPIRDLRNGELVGYESLARFTAEPQQTPDIWFNEAFEVGLGTELELKAVGLALAQAPNVPEGVYLSVNVAPATATSSKLIEVLDRYPAQGLVFEITEHAEVNDYESLNVSLRALRGHRGRLAIDDTGAGFASLRHILRLAPDIIKLDNSLTDGVEADRARRALARAFISFASEIDVKVIAEGIENQAQIDVLLELSVIYGQGYFLGRPGPLP